VPHITRDEGHAGTPKYQVAKGGSIARLVEMPREWLSWDEFIVLRARKTRPSRLDQMPSITLIGTGDHGGSRRVFDTDADSKSPALGASKRLAAASDHPACNDDEVVGRPENIGPPLMKAYFKPMQLA
jgi:hypothetical protein